MNVGIIGVGIIGSAVASGFCRSSKGEIRLVLSPRGRERTAKLKEEYPDLVTVAASNQEVVDSSDWVILSVLPEQGIDVLKELHFRPEQKLIKLVPMLSLEQVHALTGDLAVLVDVVPLPFNAEGIGPVILYPPVSEAEDLLSRIGDVVAVETPEQMSILRSVTALMSPFYELAASVTDWCTENGLSETAAKSYVTSFFGALSHTAGRFPDNLHELAREMTPGGLNWQALTDLQNKDAFTLWKDTLDPVLTRVEGK